MTMENGLLRRREFEWRSIVDEARTEVDPDRLRGKLVKAEAAIFERLQALAQVPDASDERTALEDAAATLLTLKREVLKFPDWGSNKSGGAQ